VGDAYHASATRPSAYAERIPVIRAAAEAAGRAMPRLSARIRVELSGEARDESYALRGTSAEIAAEIRAFAALGVDHLAVAFPERDPEGVTRSMDRFLTDVVPLV
jgi:alkanesulfonate monooxygenase SsuD/methylene tetrahydromethanopterin reductase-like flavin-dependent oxidoreductase (luciferase family)